MILAQTHPAPDQTAGSALSTSISTLSEIEDAAATCTLSEIEGC